MAGRLGGMMPRVERKCVVAVIIGLFACTYSVTGYARGERSPEGSSSGITSATKEKFQWAEHSRLSWDDFKGSVHAANDMSAAATFCGIGIKTDMDSASMRPRLVVYNTFYTQKSWVRDDARIQSILDHEQGHFDLCEIYTRKLRQLISAFDAADAAANREIMRIYTDINKEYEQRQQAYEQETVHGTNTAAQQRWLATISSELGSTAAFALR